MEAILLACAAMCLKDGAYTCLTVCEAHGKAGWAAMLDGFGDIASILVVLAGAGTIIVHGWTTHSFEVLGAMVVTSALGTFYWTRAANRWFPQEVVDGGS